MLGALLWGLGAAAAIAEENEQLKAQPIKELEKENKHLKEEMEIMTNFCGACKKKHEEENNKLLDVINGQDVKIADLEKKGEQAKVLLKEFINWFTDQTESNNWKPVVEQAEQFTGEGQ